MIRFLPVILFSFITIILVTGSNSPGTNSFVPGDSVITANLDSLFIAEGKALYKVKCSKCHTLYKPRDYRLKQWKENLDEMRYKAKLTDSEYNKISAYLEKYCKK